MKLALIPKAAISETAFWRAVPNIDDDIRDARAQPGMPLDQFLAAQSTPND